MTKLEPLPWFAFNVADYITDTMRLSTEAHGAYLLLMLDYYATGEPCQDDDAQLAAVTKLPVAKWTQDIRPMVQRFFVLKEGRWHHERIAREMLEATDKHAKASARAAAGGRAKARNRQQSAPQTPDRPQEPQQSYSEAASSTPQAMLAECLEPTQTQTQTQNNSLSAARGDQEGEGRPEPDGLGEPISQLWRPSPPIMIQIEAQADAGTIELEIQKFIYRNHDKGAFSNDWDAAFMVWWSRFIDHHKAQAEKAARRKAPPRVEVDVKPDQIDWDKALVRFKKNNSLWTRKLYGPEPGQPGCRVPHAKLVEHGFVTEEVKD